MCYCSRCCVFGWAVQEDYGRQHHLVEELETCGVNASVVKRLKENGFHTVESVCVVGAWQLYWAHVE